VSTLISTEESSTFTDKTPEENPSPAPAAPESILISLPTFTKPFEAAYKRLPEELVEKYGLDALKLFNEQLDTILKK